MADNKPFELFLNFLKNGSILLFSIILAFTFGWVNYSMHENRLWFSNIEEVEREISFRTECGFYYSYYKQLILNRTYASPYSILTSISSFTNDHLTESPRVINALKRFNIFQEILFSFTYSFLEYCFDVFKNLNYFKSLLKLPEPIIFYVYLCFAFSSLGIFAIIWLTINIISTFQKIQSYKNFILKYKEFEWSFGILAASWAFANLEDITRVYFSVNLRENFALPIFWIQNYFILRSLQQLKNERLQIFKNMFLIAFFTFLFSAFWQFNQFLLFIQSASLFSTYLVYSASNFKFKQTKNYQILFNINPDQYYFLNIKKIMMRIFFAQTLGFLLLIPIQEFQPMLLTSYFVQFNVATIITINFFDSTLIFQNQIFKTLVKIIFVLLLTLLLNIISTFLLGFHADDSHIWTFLNFKMHRILYFFQNNNFFVDKFYFVSELIDLPFESTIYICHGAFAFIDANFFTRISKTGIFPLYLIGIGIILNKALKLFFSFNSLNLITKKLNFNNNLNDKNNISTETSCNLNNLKPIQNNQNYSFNGLNPILLFFALQSIGSGFLAILIMRMIYLWLPQMIIISAYSLKCLFKKFFGNKNQSAIIVTLSFILLAYRGELFRQEMLNEQEFYDPDTVELMKWISENTKQNDIFTGSMQLMAGVKCCTNRPIANHPHFEDKWLRNRTQRLYQIYALKSPTEVFEILISEKINYIIIEESICFLPPNGCSITELIDLSNRYRPSIPANIKNTVLESKIIKIFNSFELKYKKTTRFCAEVNRFSNKSKNFFRLVFQNQTFRVYKILYNNLN